MISTLVTARTRDDESSTTRPCSDCSSCFSAEAKRRQEKPSRAACASWPSSRELQAELRARPDHIPAFIEELLRFEPPVKGIFRIATRDTEIGGVAVPEGSFVQLMWGSGNRDEAAFDEPDVFDAERFGDGRRPIGTSSRSATASIYAPARRSPGYRPGSSSRSSWLASARSRSRRGTTSATSAARSSRGLAGLWVDLEPAA